MITTALLLIFLHAAPSRAADAVRGDLIQMLESCN
jgi:hypothetical protein